MEQALSLTYATLRFVQLGWRVIRLEATAAARGGLPGDPNRYIGSVVAGDDRRSYFIAPNVGKEALALNLKLPEGREALKVLVRELEVDIFCCNTLPSRYQSLGIDYETLKSVRPDIIWAGISALGPNYPNTPGYDPAIQAMVGYMELTGFEDGPPTLAGIPLVDLKAGDEVYAGVCLALAERAESGSGRRIDVSMLQAAASWLITTLPLLDLGGEPEEVTRWGNAHRKFIPTNVYPARDGFIYIAIGNDVQWQRLTDLPRFAPLANAARRTNDGRYRERQAIYGEIAAISREHGAAELAADFARAKIPHAHINDIAAVRQLEALRDKLTRTRLPDGREVRMQPLATDLDGAPAEYPFPPRYGEHTVALLREAGYSEAQCQGFKDAGVIP